MLLYYLNMSESPRPGSREINLSLVDLVDVCHTARDIVDTVLESDSPFETNRVELEGIPIKPLMGPASFLTYACGTTFDTLSIAYDRNPDRPSNVRITAHDGTRTGRRVSFTEQPDDPQILIEDSHSTLQAIRNRNLPKHADRGEITRWIAAQALEGQDDAYSFVNSHPDSGIAIAAELLEMKTAAKYITQLKQIVLSNGVTLDCFYCELSDPTKMSLYPDVRCYRLAVSSEYDAATNFGVRLPWIKQTTVIEFCPEAGVSLPSYAEKDLTSVRVNIETERNVPPTAVQQLADLSALAAEDHVQDVLKKQLAFVKPVWL